MSYRLFKKYNGYDILHLKNFLNKLIYYKNNNITCLNNDDIIYLFMEKEDSTFSLIYDHTKKINNEHYINKIIKSYPEFKDLDCKILIDKNWLVDYIENNFKYDMSYEDLESFRY